MKHPTIYSFCLASLVLAAGSITGFARPIDFSEVSLLVRARESEASIKNDVAHRKLMHPLTPQQEGTLKSQGASDSLIQSLRNANNVASKEEVAEIEAQRQVRESKADQTVMHGPKVTVMTVAFGHSINLSQWGGADYEIAFYSYRVAGEDHIQPAIVDTVRTGTDVARNIPLLSEGEPLPAISSRRTRPVTGDTLPTTEGAT